MVSRFYSFEIKSNNFQFLIEKKKTTLQKYNFAVKKSIFMIVG